MDHVNVKVFAREGSTAPWHELINVFHRWIQNGTFAPILPIDVTDYSHVPMGPGVLLIGHHAAISVDNREGRLGLLYNRKTAMDGDLHAKIRHSYEGAVAAARQLEREPEALGLLSFDESVFEVFVNDRLLAPNTDATWEAARTALGEVFPDSQLERKGSSRELFRVEMRWPAAAGLVNR